MDIWAVSTFSVVNDATYEHWYLDYLFEFFISVLLAAHPKVEFLDYMVFLSFGGTTILFNNIYYWCIYALHHFTFPTSHTQGFQFLCIHVKLIFWKVFFSFFKYINSHLELFVNFAFLKKKILCAKKVISARFASPHLSPSAGQM